MHFPNQAPHRPQQRANEDTVLQDSRQDRKREDEISKSSQTRPVITHYRCLLGRTWSLVVCRILISSSHSPLVFCHWVLGPHNYLTHEGWLSPRLPLPWESPDGPGYNSLNVLHVHWFLQASEASSLLGNGHLCDIVSFTLTDKDDFKVRYSAYKNSAATQTQALMSWLCFLFNFPDWRLKT